MAAAVKAERTRAVTKENELESAINALTGEGEGSLADAISTAIATEVVNRNSAITTAIGELDSTQSQVAGADGLALSITQEDGKITAISGSIKPGTYEAEGAAETALTSAKEYADSLAENYDAAGTAAQALTDAKAYTDELANGAVKANTEAIAKLNGEDTVEGSVKKQIKDAVTEVNTAADALGLRVKANEDAIAILNGEGTVEGSVKKQVNDAVTGLVNGAPEALNTLGEIADWIAGDETKSADLVAKDVALQKAIDDLKTLVGEKLPEGATATTVIEYIAEAIEKADVSGKINAEVQKLNASVEDKSTPVNVTVTQANGVLTGVTASIVENTFDGYGEASNAYDAIKPINNSDIINLFGEGSTEPERE